MPDINMKCIQQFTYLVKQQCNIGLVGNLAKHYEAATFQ
jgi:hypothetical protein